LFTGIITDIGHVAALEHRGGDLRLAVAVGRLDLKEPLIDSEVPPAMDGRPAKQSRKRLISRSRVRTRAGLGVGWQVQDGLVQTFLERVAIGDSIAVNGVCLTAVEVGNGRFAVDVSPETLARTTLGTLALGDPVNLEPALRVGDPLGGHLVSGHVDAVGRVRAIHDEGRGQRWWFDAPSEVLRYLAWKGSIAVDGVSLTIADLDATGFAVALIPHTIAATTFHRRRPGDPVNLEVDTIARYVERLLATSPATTAR
jgi:riboflavin synthase